MPVRAAVYRSGNRASDGFALSVWTCDQPVPSRAAVDRAAAAGAGAGAAAHRLAPVHAGGGNAAVFVSGAPGLGVHADAAMADPDAGGGEVVEARGAWRARSG